MKNKILKKLIGIFGYKLIEKNYIKNTRILENNTHLTTEKILTHLFDKKRINYVIQIGANDGLRFDSLNYYIKKYKTKSILVEPIKKSYDDLKNNYKQFDNIIFENLAISVNNQISYLYKINPSKEKVYKSEHFKGIMSFDKNHLIKHGVKKNDIVQENVKSISIKGLIDKHNLRIFDLLFVDAEGYDADIINDFLVSSSIRPILIFEYVHVSSNKLLDLVDILKAKKYIFFSLSENMLCFPEEDSNLIKFN